MEATFIQNNIALIVAAVASGGLLLWPLLRRPGNEIGTMVAVSSSIIRMDWCWMCARVANTLPDTYPIQSIFLLISLKNDCMNLENSRASRSILIHRSGVNTTGKAGSLLREPWVCACA